MSTEWIYSRCAVCGHNNVRVAGIRLALHYDSDTRLPCGGSGGIAMESRKRPLPAGLPRIRSARKGGQS